MKSACKCCKSFFFYKKIKPENFGKPSLKMLTVRKFSFEKDFFIKLCLRNTWTIIIFSEVVWNLPVIKSYVSSNINESIRSVLNSLNFFYDKISQIQKSTKRIQGTKKH